MKTRKEHTVMIPPDGGWGWFIVLGSSLISFSTRAISPTFGLLFGDFLKQLGIETAGASFITSTMDGIFNFAGLMVGPFIKKYTYRKVAILGSVMSASAFFLTAPAKSMLHILITFGVLGGIGFGLVNACSLVGINDYFLKKKGQAVGLSMAGGAVGSMLMPQIIRILLDEYDLCSALLIVGALSLHAVVGAALFQPVSWHKKAVSVGVEEEETHIILPLDKNKKNPTSVSIETTNGARHDESSPSFESKKCSFSIPSKPFIGKESLIPSSSLSDDARNIFHKEVITEEESVKKLEKQNQSQLKKSVKNLLSRFSKYMDLDLLRDIVYLNIIYGLSMSMAAGMNFKFIVPFFLSDLGFSRSQIALGLSLMGVSDLCARIIVPPIIDKVTFTWRITFLFGSIGVVLGYLFFPLQTNITPIIIHLVIIGLFHGITLTSFPLVLAEYSSVHNFPSVLGLCMVCKGIFITVFGPLCGYIRDITNSYPVFVYTQALLMISVTITWTIEILISKFKHKKQIIFDDLNKDNEEKKTVTKL